MKYQPLTTKLTDLSFEDLYEETRQGWLLRLLSSLIRTVTSEDSVAIERRLL